MLKMKKLLMILMSIFLVCSVSGCEDKKSTSEPLTISIDGKKMVLGEATLQTFLDAGYKITTDAKMEQGITGMTLPERTYSVALYVSKEGNILGTIDFLNNTYKTIPYEKCTVHSYDLIYKDPSGLINYNADDVLVDGIKFKGMKIDDVKNALKGKVESFDEFKEPDGSVGVISFDLKGAYISVRFDYNTKEVATVKTEIFLSNFE